MTPMNIQRIEIGIKTCIPRLSSPTPMLRVSILFIIKKASGLKTINKKTTEFSQ